MSKKKKLIVRILEEKEYDCWSQFAAKFPSGSVYALPEYLGALCKAANARFHIIAVFRGSELVGGMPLYFEPSKAGTIVSNRLLLYYHSPVIREYDTQYPSERASRHLAILSAIENALQDVKSIHLLLHVRHPIDDIRPFLSNGWKVCPSYSYVVDISDLEKAWGRIERNLRRLIERAGKNGLVHTDDDDFDSFYRMHVATHHRKGAPVYLAQEAFRTFYLKLKAEGLGRLYHARLDDGRSVAAQLVLTGPHSISHTVCAAADDDYLALGSTPFLRWKSFEALAELGHTANDLTDAALNHVTRFKSQLGGDLVQNWVVTRPETLRYQCYRKAVAIKAKGRKLFSQIRKSSALDVG